MPHLEPLARRSWQLGNTPFKHTDVARLRADLEETEALLLLPSAEAHIHKAKLLALSIARRGSGLVPHQAMLLFSAIGQQQRAETDAASRIQSAVSALRAALGAPLRAPPV
jgi:hypothetical protein